MTRDITYRLILLAVIIATGFCAALLAGPPERAGRRAPEAAAESTALAKNPAPAKAPTTQPEAAPVVSQEPKQTGGEPDGIVQVANLVYAGTMSSKCFSDHFLIRAEKQSAISTSRRFHAVKLSSTEVYEFPLVIMTGEGAFTLPDREREMLRKYIERGGFLLASAGCSSQEWDRSFRAEMAAIFPDHPLAVLTMDHPVFHTVEDITELRAHHGKPRPLEGLSIGNRLGVIYAPDGLNDTAHTQGCCCCGGNEINDAEMINVNILAYALSY